MMKREITTNGIGKITFNAVVYYGSQPIRTKYLNKIYRPYPNTFSQPTMKTIKSLNFSFDVEITPTTFTICHSERDPKGLRQNIPFAICLSKIL